MAQSLHAITSNTPLDGASLRARAIAVFRDMCGLSIQESTLSVNRDLEKDTWRGRPQGGTADLFAALAKHVDGSVVLLRSDRYSIVTSGFGVDSALTSATVWVPGREHPLHYRDCGDMEEQCHRATVVVIAEAERDGVKGGGHFRGAVFDHSLQVAPFCTLHGMMGILAYKRGPVGGVRAWHLQLGVGGMKGHTNATDCRRTRLVQRTRNHGGRSWSGPDPKGGGGGGGPPPLRTPKLSHGTRCFVGAGGAGDFVLGIRQGEFFLFHPMCLSSKYSEFCGEFKNG